MSSLQTFREILRDSKKILILTGAGISTESNIPDFRSQNGRYGEKGEFRDLISHYQFKKDPEEFWRTFKEIFGLKFFKGYQPNSGHKWIANLEKEGKEVVVVTQNVDNLHEAAGSSEVIHLHGSIEHAHCPKCRTTYDAAYILSMDVPWCMACKRILETDVVLYGEEPYLFDTAMNHMYASDLVLVMGTSLEVSPANLLPYYASRTETIYRVLVNREETMQDYCFQHIFRTEIGRFVGEVEQEIEKE